MKERETEDSRLKLIEEQAKLSILPDREDGVLCEIQEGLASSYGTIRVGNPATQYPTR